MNKLNEEQLYYAVFFLLDRFYDQYEEEFKKIYFDYYVGIYAFDLQSIFKRLSKKDWEKCCNYAIEFLKGNKN